MSETEKFSLATHAYVRLRRANGRVIDAVWMAENDDYARAIIHICRGFPADAELQGLCDRFELLLHKAAPATRGARKAEPPAPAHYVGALR